MKAVLITGTSKGIGLETELAYGRAGYKLNATMRNPKKAEDMRQKNAEQTLSKAISKM